MSDKDWYPKVTNSYNSIKRKNPTLQNEQKEKNLSPTPQKMTKQIFTSK